MQKDILVTMHEDLERALEKPPEKRRWAMLLDVRKCVGCHACTVACVSENKLPPKLYYRPVYDYERGKYPNVSRTFLPRPCMQCDKPPCVAACPVKGKDGATWKETTGIGAGTVPIDYKKCIGCGKCVPACPYGARTLDDGTYHSDGTPELQKYETDAVVRVPRGVAARRQEPAGRQRAASATSACTASRTACSRSASRAASGASATSATRAIPRASSRR